MSSLFQQTPVLASLFTETPIFSTLRLSVLSLIALAILVTHGTVFQRIATSLQSKLDSDSSLEPEQSVEIAQKTSKQSLKKSKEPKTKQTDSNSSSLFPPIVYESISSTNKNVVACATNSNFNYYPIENTDGIARWDIAPPIDMSFMYEQDKVNSIPLEQSPMVFSSGPTSSSSSPVTEEISVNDPAGFYNGLGFEVNALSQPQLLHAYPPQQQLPVVNYKTDRERQLSHGNDSVITNPTSSEYAYTPPELESLTPQQFYSSSPEESGVLNSFTEQPSMMFPPEAVQFLATEAQVDNSIFGEVMTVQPQVLPNSGLYPEVHSRSNSVNVEDYIPEMDKGLISTVPHPINPMNFNMLSSDMFYIQQRQAEQFQHLDQRLQGPPSSTHPEMMPFIPQFPGSVPVGPGFLSPTSEFTSPPEQLSSSESSDSQKVKHPFSCPHCQSSFRIRGYLTRHMKKHATKKAYSCPFYDPSDKTPCHPSGGFSRRDTYKTHLKARHFMYPAGTRSENRSKVPGMCSGCGQKFDSNEMWVEEHIHNRQCAGLHEHYH